jgi:hypothetical protein
MLPNSQFSSHLPLPPKCRSCDIAFIGPGALRSANEHFNKCHRGMSSVSDCRAYLELSEWMSDEIIVRVMRAGWFDLV